MRLYEELETGAECERLAPTLLALVSGTATSDALLDLRPHLRNCAACRATVRDLHASKLRRLSSFLPLGALIEPARALIERFRGPDAEQVGELRPMERSEQLDEAFRRINSGEAAIQPVAPSAVEAASGLSGARVNLRGWLETALQRLQSSDVAMGVHTAASGGGGRITSVAALIGICLSGAGAGTYCVATALLPDPKPAIRAEAKPRKHPNEAAARRRAQTQRTDPSPVRLARVQSTPSAQGSREEAPASNRSERARNPAVQPDEFSFEWQAARTASGGSAPRTTRQSPALGAPDGSFESGASASRPSAARGEFSDGTGGEFSP